MSKSGTATASARKMIGNHIRRSARRFSVEIKKLVLKRGQRRRAEAVLAGEGIFS